MYDITSIGEILIDLTRDGEDDKNIPMYKANAGGAPANLVVAASRLGAKTAFVGKVGRDYFGDLLKETLVNNKVNVDYLYIDEVYLTTLAVVSVDFTGERSFGFYRDPSADVNLLDHEIPEELIANSKILHIGSLSLTNPNSRAATYQALEYAQKHRVNISYDPNYRASLWPSEEYAVEQILQVLPFANIVKMSDEELLLLTQSGTIQERASSLQAQYDIPLLLVTLGSEGALYVFKGSLGHVPGIQVKVTDTNGAGDTFFGAFLAKLTNFENIEILNPTQIEEFITYANRAAAITISRPGAIPAMPSKEELLFSQS